jgi:putative PIN family toxin of toxin-antitoxin system
MIRVVIDTNVLVSALLTSGGLPEAIINLAISGEVQWFASESVLAEYEEVLQRPRLAIDSVKAADAMARILATVSMVSPAVRVTAASDTDDNQFLECAEAAQAHYLITSLPGIFAISLKFGTRLEL